MSDSLAILESPVRCIYERKNCAYSSVSYCFECSTYADYCDSLSEEERWDLAWEDEFTPAW